MVLGLYYITKGKKTTETEIIKGQGMTFYNMDEVLIAYNEGIVDLHAAIKVRTNVREGGKLSKKIIDTTVGRVLFNQHVPEEVGFINAEFTYSYM